VHGLDVSRFLFEALGDKDGEETRLVAFSCKGRGSLVARRRTCPSRCSSTTATARRRRPETDAGAREPSLVKSPRGAIFLFALCTEAVSIAGTAEP
jgi:hypothetical protein